MGVPLTPGSALPLQTRPFVSMDELFYTFTQIAKTIETIGNSSKELSSQAQLLIQALQKSISHAETLLTKLAAVAEDKVKVTSDMLTNVAEEIKKTVIDVRAPVHEIGAMAKKLHSEGSVIEDIRMTAQCAKSCIERVRGYKAALDTHLEILPVKHCGTNVKGYFDIWLYPRPDLFCLIGPVIFAKRVCKKNGRALSPLLQNTYHRKKDNFRLNLQLGACVPHGIMMRAGLFQGTAGFGVDWILPLDRVRWVSTFEAFDFNGHTRFDCDKRPYLKWINRLFFTPNLYLVFGANDFISKHYKSALIGLGGSFSTGDLLPYR